MSGSSTATFRLNGVYANQLRFSRDGKRLAIVGNLSRLLTGEVRIVDLQTGGQMSLKVSEKGALSVYGLGRFPVTLYREQWEKLLGMGDEIRTFISQHDSELKKKE